MSRKATPAPDATAATPRIADFKLEHVLALPFVDVSALAPSLVSAISEAYHLAVAMIDEARRAAGEIRVALAKVVALVAQARLSDRQPDRRDIKAIAAEAVGILSGLRPLPGVKPAL
jgi:hypothetical protein